MIYGITIFLNDVNFSLKDREKQVVSRMSVQEFYTNKKAATEAYKFYVQRWKREKSVSYGNYDQRGRCELYIAHIESGTKRILPNGKIILSEPNN